MNTKFKVGSINYTLIVSPRGRDELPDIGTSIEYHPWTTTSDRQKAKMLGGLGEVKGTRQSEAGRQPRLPGDGKFSQLIRRKRDGKQRRMRECVSI